MRCPPFRAGRREDPLGGPGRGTDRPRKRLRAWRPWHSPRTTLLACALFCLVAIVAGVSGLDRLSTGGNTPDGSPAVRAGTILSERYGRSAPDLVLLLRDPAGNGDGQRVIDAARTVERHVRGKPGVTATASYLTARDPSFLSRDRRSTLVTVVLAGDEARKTDTARHLVPLLKTGRPGPEVALTATGPAWTRVETLERNRADLVRAELISAPLSALILLFVFRSLLAALLPVVSALVATAGTLAALRALTCVTEVSVYASSITSALGFGLAVDYGILMVSRFREESAAGAGPEAAITRSVRTAGRAVLVSAGIVATSLCALFVFPLGFLRSAAAAGIAVIVFSAAASVIVIPALLALGGRYIDRFDLFGPFRRRRCGAPPGDLAWRRAALAITRRPVVCALTAAAALTVMALPAAHAVLGPNSTEDLPRDTEARTTATAIRDDFLSAPGRDLVIGLPARTPRPDVERYARALSGLPDTAGVRTFTGHYRDGRKTAAPEPWDAAFSTPAGPVLTVTSRHAPADDRSAALVRHVRALHAPGEAHVVGEAAQNVDTLGAIRHSLPWGFAIAASASLLLMTLFTRSLLVPVKALVMACWSLAATLGLLVYGFQDGHLQDAGHQGSLSAVALVFLLMTAYALSVDYEVFLVARIREEYLASGDNTAAVVAGMQRTGRLITAAALVFAAAMASPATSATVPLQLTGLGLACAVLLDATVVRGVLVPALMTLAGGANWWLPGRRGTRPVKPVQQEEVLS
ncbi:MMPL family transporter [Streptomyces sp. NPDC046215]|uniref:MMPL family transporter n=1 Tax=Streptomyces stramineus TaxID=173861 RepID=A0ABN0ZAV6_9ACTN